MSAWSIIALLSGIRVTLDRPSDVWKGSVTQKYPHELMSTGHCTPQTQCVLQVWDPILGIFLILLTPSSHPPSDILGSTCFPSIISSVLVTGPHTCDVCFALNDSEGRLLGWTLTRQAVCPSFYFPTIAFDLYIFPRAQTPWYFLSWVLQILTADRGLMCS